MVLPPEEEAGLRAFWQAASSEDRLALRVAMGKVAEDPRTPGWKRSLDLLRLRRSGFPIPSEERGFLLGYE
jgi:hypothetical protein